MTTTDTTNTPVNPVPEVPLHKLVSKGFFNTLSPDVCHHILKLAQERLDETEGEYRRQLSQSKWEANKAALGRYLVQSIIDGTPLECDVTTEVRCLVGIDGYASLVDVLKGPEALVEEYDFYIENRENRISPKALFTVTLRGAHIPGLEGLDGCHIAENMVLRMPAGA